MSKTDQPSSSRRGAALTVAVLLGLLVSTIGVTWWGWHEIGDVEFSVHGWIALALGIGLTLLCGIGLMGLVFFSSRRGYDDRAHGWTREHRESGAQRPSDRGRPEA